MTNEEAINHGKEQLEIFGGEHKEFIIKAIQALEAQTCVDKQDCEHCIHTYGTLGCCDTVNNRLIYDCDFGKAQFKKQHQQPCEDCISRETIINELNNLCDCLCEYSQKQRATMCDACHLGSVFDKVNELPSVQPKKEE